MAFSGSSFSSMRPGSRSENGSTSACTGQGQFLGKEGLMKVAEMCTVLRTLRACLRRYRRMSLGCCLVLTLAAPAYAIEGPFRVSQFDGAVQIWFEAEHFDERIPDTDDFFPIVDADGALSGKAMTRAGGAGGCVR